MTRFSFSIRMYAMLLAAASLLAFLPSSAVAQCDSSVQTAKPGFLPMYEFNLQKDSVWLIYTIGEFSSAGRPLLLDSWCENRYWNVDTATDVPNAQLSTTSRSRAFSLTANDTISFYRDVYWMAKYPDDYAPYYYTSDDIVTYSVELVNAKSGQRLALLDTIRFGTTTPTRKPCYYGWKPVLAQVSYKIPPDIATASATGFIQVNVASAGASNTIFTRFDTLMAAGASTSLHDKAWLDYAQDVESNIDCTPACEFALVPMSGPRRIRVNVLTTQGIDNIRVMDLQGKLVNTIAITADLNTADDKATIPPFEIPVGSGQYTVASFNGTALKCTRTIYVP